MLPVETVSERSWPHGVVEAAEDMCEEALRAPVLRRLPGDSGEKPRLSERRQAHLDGTQGPSSVKMGPLYPLKEVFLALN